MIMVDLYATDADFEAEVRILTRAEGGRRLPPQNYIRWDFGYAEDNPDEPTRHLSAMIYMIYPNFLDESGLPIPRGIPLVGTLAARMHILDRRTVGYHKGRIKIGIKFNCHEGTRIVARGEVTKLLAISD